MKIHLHLADTGLALLDLSLRVYEGSASPVIPIIPIPPSVTLTPRGSSGTDYTLDGLTTNSTVTFENPSGVYHAYRLGIASTQPRGIIIPIREIFSDPVSALTIRVFKDDVEVVPNLSDVTRLSSDGEYLVSGWPYTSLGEQWSVRWIYNDITYAHQWTGESVIGVGTFYLWILASTSPIDISPDSQGRATWSINYSAVALGPSINLEKEMAQLLVNAGLGVRGSTIKVGRLVTIPDIDPRAETDPTYDILFTQIINTGGSGTDDSHDGISNELLSFQVLVRAVSYDLARTKAYAAWRALDGKRNITVVAA